MTKEFIFNQHKAADWKENGEIKKNLRRNNTLKISHYYYSTNKVTKENRASETLQIELSISTKQDTHSNKKVD